MGAKLMHRWHRLAAAAGAACLFLGVVAVSPSSSGASTTSAKTPIKVLTFGDITGLFPTPQNDLVDAVRAAVDAFNAAGGVQGRKVDLITCNTEFNPATAASCVENAKADGVVLAIPSFEIFDSVTTPILETQKIPVFGAPSTAAAAFDPDEACFVAGAFTLYPAGATQMAKAGVKSMSVLEPLGVPNTDEINQAVDMAASAAGMKIGAVVGVSPVATNLSAIAAQATDANEDGSFLLESSPALLTLISGIAQNHPGIKMDVFGPDLAIPQVLTALSKIPAAKGIYGVNATVWPTDTSIPGIRLYDKEIGKLDKSAVGNAGGLPPWIDAWGAMQVLSTMKKGAITAATVTAAMKKASVSFEGVAPNWRYQYDKLGQGCVNANEVYLGRYEGGSSVKPVNGDKPVKGLSTAIINYYKQALAPAAS
jgi:ABC-type branched-subunit amino acid transport system substrate-binding protein